MQEHIDQTALCHMELTMRATFEQLSPREQEALLLALLKHVLGHEYAAWMVGVAVEILEENALLECISPLLSSGF